MEVGTEKSLQRGRMGADDSNRCVVERWRGLKQGVCGWEREVRSESSYGEGGADWPGEGISCSPTARRRLTYVGMRVVQRRDDAPDLGILWLRDTAGPRPPMPPEIPPASLSFFSPAQHSSLSLRRTQCGLQPEACIGAVHARELAADHHHACRIYV